MSWLAPWRRIALGIRRRALVGWANWIHRGGRPRVLYICFGLRRFGSSDAIRKETLDFRRKISLISPSASGYIASLEKDLTRPAWDWRHRALLWPQAGALSLVHDLRPDFVHVVEETVAAFFGLGFDRKWLCPTILTATGADPVQIRDEDMLLPLRRAIDLGTLTLVVESESAAALCEAKGLRCAAVIPPGVECHEEESPPGGSDGFTVGFASSPFSEEGWQGRGVTLLLDTAATCPDVQFLLAWREGSPSADDAIRARGLANVSLRRGTIDMADFYGQIHVLLLPYRGASGNHACPLSGVEALVRGIPLVVTHDVGLADSIREYGAGQVVAPIPAEIKAGIRAVQEAWHDMRCQALKLGQERYALSERTRRYLPLYTKLSRLVTPPCQPSEGGGGGDRMGAIFGRRALRAYYESPDLAANYARERFNSLPLQIVEESERRAVFEIVSAYGGGRASLTALDIASGEGRILRTLSTLADCIALEPAEAMVRRSHAMLPSGHRVRFVRGDAFSTPFRLKPHFDIVTAFRFIRHYAYPDRQMLYSTVRQLMRPDGLFLADFPNVVAETRLRDHQEWHPYPVYDVFWTAGEAQRELRRNGFNAVQLIALGQGLFPELVPWGEEPLLWVGAFTLAAASSPGFA